MRVWKWHNVGADARPAPTVLSIYKIRILAITQISRKLKMWYKIE